MSVHNLTIITWCSVCFVAFTLSDKVICENGQAVVVYGGFCEECKKCPIGVRSSYMFMSSNCSKSSNHICPKSRKTSKICMDEVKVSMTDFCLLQDAHDYWKCPKANKGLNFEQCYKM